MNEQNRDSEPQAPAAVLEIVGLLNLEAFIVLGLACLILIFDIAANARSDIAFDIWGVPGLLLGALGAVLVKLTRDFRKCRSWTFPYASLVLSLFPWSRGYCRRMERADVRRAFGLDRQ